MANPILPKLEFGIPFFNAFQVSPPSVLLCKPDPGPPPRYPATVLCLCHVAAYKTVGFVGSISKSVAPTHSESPRVRFQVLPPSIDLYTPLSPPLLHKGPCEATQIISESSG